MAKYLEYMVPQISSPAHWEQSYYRLLIQPLERWATECQQLYGDRGEWRGWWQRFSQMFPAVMANADRYIAATQQDTSDAVYVQLKLAGYDHPGASLSQAALHVLVSLQGVSSVLVGMRRPEYVADAFGALESPAVAGQEILTSFRSLNS
jgi:hypothetical protein